MCLEINTVATSHSKGIGSDLLILKMFVSCPLKHPYFVTNWRDCVLNFTTCLSQVGAFRFSSMEMGSTELWHSTFLICSLHWELWDPDEPIFLICSLELGIKEVPWNWVCLPQCLDHILKKDWRFRVLDPRYFHLISELEWPMLSISTLIFYPN